MTQVRAEAAPPPAWRADVERVAAALPAWRTPRPRPLWYLDIDPGKTRYSRPEFVPYRNEAFVEQLHRAVLKRGPDVLELDAMLGRLAAGEKEVMLIGDLLASAEARARGVRVRGIGSRYRLARLFSVPVIGGLLERLYLVLQVHVVVREQRLVEDRVTRVGEQAEDYTAQSVTRLQMEIERLQRQVASLEQAARSARGPAGGGR